MCVVIFNCKRCKIGKRVEYPVQGLPGYFYRIDAQGMRQPAAVWIQAWGGGKPTVYGGDAEMGVCGQCGKMMSFGKLKAVYRPEVKCDARCEGARGHSCECACGGANHGKGR